jgi:Ca2+-binding EF-hand superfamily protein
MSSSKLSRTVGFAFGVAAVTGFALLPSVAVAHANRPEATFESMDANEDGKISTDEHFAAASRMFEKMDTNADGKVTAAEMTAAHQRITGKKEQKTELTAAEKIKVLDTDGDGVLTSEEHAAGARSMFDKMDTDKDGYLSKAEFKGGHDKLLRKPTTSSGSSRSAD